MKKESYVHVENGDWVVVPDGHVLHLQCCDCKLVHEIKLRKREGKTELQFTRHERATAALRRKRKQKVIKE